MRTDAWLARFNKRMIIAVMAFALALVGLGEAVGVAGADDAPESTTTTVETTTSSTPTTTASTTTTIKPTTTTTRPPTTTTRPPTTTTTTRPPTTTTPPKPDLKGLPAGSGSGRRIVYSVARQRVWWVEADGRVSNTYLVSGRVNTPRPGTYHVFSKSVNATSMNGKARMKHMVRFAWGRGAAIGFHSIPVDGRGRPLQSEAELGQYRSAGCVRQRNYDAAFLYMWAPVGTKVVVVK